MKFTVCRSSEHGEEKPCDESKQEINSNTRNHWTLKLTSLKDLLKFIDKYGKVVISKPSWRIMPKYEIEIYDTHRE